MVVDVGHVGHVAQHVADCGLVPVQQVLQGPLKQSLLLPSTVATDAEKAERFAFLQPFFQPYQRDREDGDENRY